MTPKTREFEWTGPDSYVPDVGRIVHTGDIITLPAKSTSPHMTRVKTTPTPKPKETANADDPTESR